MRYLSLLLFALNLQAYLLNITDESVANGKSTLLEFVKEPNIEYKSVEFENKFFKIFPNPLDKEKLYALIPVSYYSKAALKELKIHYQKSGKKIEELIFFKIKDGNYTKEILHVDSSKVNPKSSVVKKRVAKEYNAAMKIYHTLTPKSYLKKPFILPMDSKITSDFGRARVYNGTLKGYHSGTDFRAKVGTPVYAANDGVVALVAKRFYSGGTVLLNHGQGIYTCYFHMSRFHVKEGEVIKRGQILGLSGKSGRVTGPHLHFSARIDGVQVDPLQLISLLNNNLLKED